MMQPIEYIIARRFLRSKRKVRFINVISMISVVGITVGVGALLVVLAVFNGFSDVVTGVLVGFDPHLRIEKSGAFTEYEAKAIETILQSDRRVRAAAPFVSGKAMLIAKSYQRVVYLRGVDQRLIGAVSGLGEKMIYGRLSLADSAGGSDIIIGLTLADRLATITGDQMLIVSPEGLQSALSTFGAPQTLKFHVSGIYQSDNRDYDANYAFISVASAQRLFQMNGRYNGIDIRIDDFRNAEDVKDALSGALPPGVTISTWYDLHKSLYTVMQVERWSSYVLLSLIILVATFNMLGSLSMGVIEKKRDIGVLKAMGMPSNGIVRIFMFEGMLIGVIGTVLGFAFGLLVIYLQAKYSLFALDTNVYIIPAIPVKIRWTDFLAVAIASLGLSSLAAYYPASRAGKAMAADSLRWE